MNRAILPPRYWRRPGWWALLAILVAGLAPAAARAHERWFTPFGPYWVPDWSLLVSLPVGLALLSGGGVVLALTLLQHRLDDPLWPRPPFFQRIEPSTAAILGVQTAITMIFGATRLHLFAPNIELPRNVAGLAIAGLTVLAAFTFITGVMTRWGSALTIGLWGTGFAIVAWYEMLEQAIFVGIALYLLGVGRGVVAYGDHPEEAEPVWSAFLRQHALTILRLFAGATVLLLAFTEKLLAPDLGVAFLEAYPEFNVARGLGLSWFTDERFISAAGIVEATAGIALLSGKLIRVVILLLWIPFNLGVPFLPPEELIGHLPMLATMYVLLVRGTAGIPPPGATGSAAADPFPPQPESAAVVPGRPASR